MTAHEINDESVWQKTFDQTLRDEQRQEDSAAWQAVTGLLLSIISIGLTLALLTVWICSGS